MVLQRTILLSLLQGQCLLLLHQSIAVTSQEGDLVLLILDLVVLVIGKGSPHCLDLLLETSDDPLLLVSLTAVLQGYFLRLFDAGPLLGCRSLDDSGDHLFQLVDLGKQFAVLQHETSAVAQGNIHTIALISHPNQT